MLKNNTRYEVLTKDGFKDFKGIKKTYREDNIKLYFSDSSSIIVTPEHRLLDYNNEYVFAKDVSVGDILSDKVVSLIEHNVECSNNFYDLIEVDDGNNYITSELTSHNCAFISGKTWKEFEDSVFPTVAAIEGSQIIITSTANGLNHFYQMIKSAKLKKSTYKYNEMQWWEVPGRDEEWRKQIISDNGLIYFNQNFGNEFIGSSSTLIDSGVLKNLPVDDPILYSKEGIHNIRVYEGPQPGHNYVIGVDPAKEGLDYFAFNIIDVTSIPFKQVLSANLHINYLELALPIYNLAIEYNEAYVIIENNEGAGQSLNDMLFMTYEYENIFKETKSKVYGYRTTTRTRKLMLTQLKALIESENLVIKDKECQEELFHFLEIKGKFQADEGYHDDLVMSLGISVSFLNDVRNFEDMKKYVEMLNKSNKKLTQEEKEEQEDIKLKDILKIGAFETHDDSDYKNKYYDDSDPFGNSPLYRPDTGQNQRDMELDPFG